MGVPPEECSKYVRIAHSTVRPRFRRFLRRDWLPLRQDLVARLADAATVLQDLREIAVATAGREIDQKIGQTLDWYRNRGNHQKGDVNLVVYGLQQSR